MTARLGPHARAFLCVFAVTLALAGCRGADGPAGPSERHVTRLTLSPDPDTADLEGWTQLTAIAQTDDGDTVDAPLSFSSTRRGVASVNDEGRVEPVNTGTTTIIAETTSGIRDSATVVVEQIPPDVAAGALDFRPKGVLIDSTTRGDIVIENRGGYLEALHWHLEAGGERRDWGTVHDLRARSTDTIPTVIGNHSTAGARKYRLTLDPREKIEEDSSRADNQASAYLMTRRPGFDIELVFEGAVSDSMRQIAHRAEDRWEDVVTGDVPDLPAAAIEGDVFLEPVGRDDEPVDDLVVVVATKEMENRHGVAYAGGTFRNLGHDDMPGAPATGKIALDPTGTPNNYATALHEIGHVLGLCGENYIAGETVVRAEAGKYIGAGAVAAYRRLGGSTRYVPMEDDAHWDSNAFATVSVMADGYGPYITPVSIGALGDMGYAVDPSEAAPTELEPGY